MGTFKVLRQFCLLYIFISLSLCVVNGLFGQYIRIRNTSQVFRVGVTAAPARTFEEEQDVYTESMK